MNSKEHILALTEESYCNMTEIANCEPVMNASSHLLSSDRCLFAYAKAIRNRLIEFRSASYTHSRSRKQPRGRSERALSLICTMLLIRQHDRRFSNFYLFQPGFGQDALPYALRWSRSIHCKIAGSREAKQLLFIHSTTSRRLAMLKFSDVPASAH